jgi:hypothetical protein
MTENCRCSPQAGSPFCDLSPESTAQPAAACPTNRQVGKPVSLLTLQALLTLPLTHLTPTTYRFCRAADCPTVYYSAEGTDCFSEDALREQVYQKHPGAENSLVCYCFQHTLGSIRAEWEKTGASTVVADITAGIQAGQCACEIRNPQGSCCLGNVQAVVEHLENERHQPDGRNPVSV